MLNRIGFIFAFTGCNDLPYKTAIVSVDYSDKVRNTVLTG